MHEFSLNLIRKILMHWLPLNGDTKCYERFRARLNTPFCWRFDFAFEEIDTYFGFSSINSATTLLLQWLRINVQEISVYFTPSGIIQLWNLNISVINWADSYPYSSADLESDHLHLDLHVKNAEVIIVCFHDTLYQLKYFGLQCTLLSNFACSSHNDPDCWNNKVYHFV